MSVNNKVRVRRAKPGDEKRIAEIHVSAWRAAYSSIMGKTFLDSLSVDERQKMWSSALREKSKGVYLVGELAGCVEGFCVYGPARDDDMSETDSELVAINVAPEKWGNGIGNALLTHVIEDVNNNEKYASLHLWVLTENTRAIEFYTRRGFISEGVTKYESGHSGNPIREERYVRACQHSSNSP